MQDDGGQTVHEPFEWSELRRKGMPQKPGARRRAARVFAVVAVVLVVGFLAVLTTGDVFGILASGFLVVLFGGIALDLRRPPRTR